MRSGFKLSMVPDPDTYISSSGDTVQILYQSVENNGFLSLEPNGKVDIHQSIQSYASTTDMNFIMSRLAAGDASVLNVSNGFYGDVSHLTNDHRAAMQSIMDAQTYFDRLDSATKLKFDNSFVSWIQSAGTPDWVQKMVPQQILQNNGDNQSAAITDPDNSHADSSAK